jgi:hypothetical protein
MHGWLAGYHGWLAAAAAAMVNLLCGWLLFLKMMYGWLAAAAAANSPVGLAAGAAVAARDHVWLAGCCCCCCW